MKNLAEKLSQKPINKEIITNIFQSENLDLKGILLKEGTNKYGDRLNMAVFNQINAQINESNIEDIFQIIFSSKLTPNEMLRAGRNIYITAFNHANKEYLNKEDDKPINNSIIELESRAYKLFNKYINENFMEKLFEKEIYMVRFIKFGYGMESLKAKFKQMIKKLKDENNETKLNYLFECIGIAKDSIDLNRVTQKFYIEYNQYLDDMAKFISNKSIGQKILEAIA